MPSRCTICSHPQRADIDQALVGGVRVRTIVDRFSVSLGALSRHRNRCLVEQIARVEQVTRSSAVGAGQPPHVAAIVERRDAEALDVMTELRRLFARLNKLMDACDRWLTDPDDPERYDLSPRAREVAVVYEETVAGPHGRGRIVQRKATLQDLLARVTEQTGHGVVLVETKQADPRDLLRKTAGTLRPQIELLAKLIGELDERPPVSIVVMPEWLLLRAEMTRALRAHPEAKAALVEHLSALSTGGA